MSIVLVPIGKVDPAEMQALRDALKAALSRDVTLGEDILLPATALNAARSQYDAEMVLGALMLSREAAGHGRVLGVTDVDLYFPGMNFVFGIAGRRCAVFSLHRLRQSFYLCGVEGAEREDPLRKLGDGSRAPSFCFTFTPHGSSL